MSFSRIHAAVLTAVTACLLATPAAALAATSTTSSDYGEDTKLNLPSTNADGATAATGGGGGGIVRTFVGLAVVVGRHLRPLLGPQAGQGLREERAAGARPGVVAIVPLGPNRSLHLVRAGDELVLVGVAEHGVTPIRTYTEEEARAAGLIADEGARTTTTRPGAAAEPAGSRRAAAARADRRRARSTRSAQRTVRAIEHAVDGGNAVQLLLLLGGVTLVPALLFTVTGFTRILIVLGFIRTRPRHADRAAEPGAGRHRAVPDALRDGADVQRRSRRTRSSRSRPARSPRTQALKRARGADARVHVQADARQGPRAVREAREDRAAEDARRRPDPRPDPGVHHLRAEDGVPDRLPDLPAVPRDRPRRRARR